MLKVALTGASGLVGSRIIELLKNDFIFLPLSHNQMDITKKDSILTTLQNVDFDIFLHLAAYTNVDRAETEEDLAYQINVEGTKNIQEAIKNKNKKLIYISTGFVFDGANPPYNEVSIPNPQSVYAKTKWQGEEIVNPPAGGQAMIVRIEYPYRAKYDPKRDFVATIKKLLSENKNINMVNDSLITPTFIDDVAYALKYLFNNFSPEIFHIVGSSSLSPYQAGQAIARVFNLDEKLIIPISAADYFRGKAQRPKNAIIKSIKNNFYKMKSFEEGLRQIKSQLSIIQ